MTDILQILRADHEVSAKGTSIGTAKFEPKLKTLTLIMFSNLYPLSNIGFINLGRAQFLCDLIIGALIGICAYILQTMGKTAARTAAQMCLPFYSLIMKIMLLKGVCPPRDGTILVRQCPISIVSLQMSKSHSSAEREKHNPSKTPKSGSAPHVTPSSHGLAAHTTLGISRLHLLTLLSRRLLALSLDNLALMPTGWLFWLRACMSIFQDLLMSSNPPTTKFKCISQPLRHN